MSIVGENNAYVGMISDDKIMENFNFANEIVLVTKTEPNMEETIEHEGMIIGSGELPHQDFTITKNEVFYENESNNFDEVSLDYLNNPSMSCDAPLNDSIGEQEIEEDEEEMKDPNNFVYSSIDPIHPTDLSQDDDSEEETIATFLTAAGQQLALYAVEDSDEIFAVARYDESGAPPENFQFLVKADVEKLIGEGAVRTVKKPSQLKKQLYSIDPSAIPTRKEPVVPQSQPLKVNTSPGTVKKYYPIKPNHRIQPNVGNNRSQIAKPNVGNRTLTYQKYPDGSMVLIHDDSAEIEHQDNKISKIKSEEVKKSTVQYILQEGEEDTSDLTLDDIEQVLNRSADLESSFGDEPPCFSPLSSPEKPTNKNVPEILNNSKLVPIYNFSLKTNYEKLPDKQTSFIPRSVTPVMENANCIESSSPKVSIDESVVLSRIKRSRKQQLVVVNRADSEIIIQPASLIDFEDEDDIRPARKRGRRKKKIQDTLRKGNSTMVKSVKTRTSLARKYGKHRSCRIEVIDIDIESDEEEDEEENGETEGIDGTTVKKNKEKGSSDKENNDVIMVGDSEDEESELETSAKKTTALHFKCTHCSRTFRQQRALATHSRMCPKSPTTRRRITERTTSTRSTRSSSSSDQSSGSSNNNKKQYACKVCGEKFDVVVALARHARLVHSLKKKRISSNSRYDEPSTTPLVGVKSREVRVELKRLSESSITKSSTNARRKLPMNENTKGKSKSSTHVRTWKSTKMKASCSVCGRWFPSAALLSAHSLQHATKKTVSEKQMRRCQICSKKLTSRLIYIRHMKMHSNKKQLQKTLRATRQSTSQITPIKKRGRPRKF